MFQNWAGNVRFEPREIVRPRDVASLQAIIRTARERRETVRVVGAGHSFSPLIESRGVLLDLAGMSGLIRVDADARTATFWAGTPIRAVGPLLAPHGLALSNQGDIDHQTLAGAMSTGTHGTGLAYASLASFMTKAEFVDGTGELRSVDESTPGDLLNAVKVALGAFGVLTQITLRCEPAFLLRDQRRKVSLRECLDDLPRAIRHNRHYEFFWFPYSPYVQIKRCNVATKLARRSPLVRFVADDLLERAAYSLLCRTTARFPRLSVTTSRFCGGVMPDADYTDESFRVYPSSRHVRFTEMEYAVPLASGVACFLDLKDFIERERLQVFFPVEFRVAGPDAAWISPMYGRDSAILSIHVFKGTDQERYFGGAQAIFKRHGGRPHWGKVHDLARTELADLYPKWSEFLAIRAGFDPGGVFLNDMLHRYV